MSAQHTPVHGPVTDEENERFSQDVSNFRGADPAATKYALEAFLRRRAQAHQPAAEINQCDGCRAGQETRGSLHVDRDSKAVMTCQASKYQQPVPVQEPYAWVVIGTGLFSIGPERPFDDDVWQPLYTAPQAQQP